MIDLIINTISQQALNEAKNSPLLLRDMAHMEKYLAESYSGRILIELLQNADDSCSTRVLIQEIDNHIVFANNGKPFDESDIISICRSGASRKRKGDFIGYRGIGFKSTTSLAKSILIHSNQSTFFFSKQKTSEILESDLDNVPTIRIPFIYSGHEYDALFSNLENQGYSTIFLFELANKKIIVEEINSLHEDLFLFLNNLQIIDISCSFNRRSLNIVRKNEHWGTKVTIAESAWAVFNNCIAFKLDKENCITKCKTDESIFYSFLPTLDKSPYPLKINGNFTTDPSRKHILVDIETQESLNNISVVFSNLIKKAFLKPSPFYKNLLSITLENNSFSPINQLYRKSFTKIINHLNLLPLNNDTFIRISQYKLFPDNFESSFIHNIRNVCPWIKEQSIRNEIYEEIDNIDNFIQHFCTNCSNYTLQDFIEIISDPKTVKELSEYSYSYLLRKIIDGYNRSKIVSRNSLSLDFSRVLIPINGEICKLNTCGLNSNNLISILNKSDNADPFSPIRIKSFVEAVGIKYIEDSKPKLPILKKSACEQVEKKIINSSIPIIPKWRSAESACLEIERFLGNVARDVSKQNLGYDIVSETPSGKTRYIEVKLIVPHSTSFSLTNNEFTAAHLHGNDYYICLITQGESNSKAIYIQNPTSKLQFEKKIKQWEWICESFYGDSIDIEYR